MSLNLGLDYTISRQPNCRTLIFFLLNNLHTFFFFIHQRGDTHENQTRDTTFFISLVYNSFFSYWQSSNSTHFIRQTYNYLLKYTYLISSTNSFKFFFSTWWYQICYWPKREQTHKILGPIGLIWIKESHVNTKQKPRPIENPICTWTRNLQWSHD